MSFQLLKIDRDPALRMGGGGGGGGAGDHSTGQER